MASDVLVSIQSQSVEEMEKLTAGIDAAVQDPASGPARVTLGAIEATMSRVVTVDEPYLQTIPHSIPTLHLLKNVQFEPETETWTLTYQSMKQDPSQSINAYKRVLYLTRGGDSVVGDTRNQCLVPGVSHAVCLQTLAAGYVTAANLTVDADALILHGIVETTVTEVSPPAVSLMQTISISIPHKSIRETLARVEVHESDVFGKRRQYTFGIGVMFVGSGNNLAIFDTFNLIENAHAQLGLSKVNSYSVAQHVSFSTSVIETDSTARIATVQYLLDYAQDFVSAKASINGNMITDEQCTAMQHKASGNACLTRYKLCEPHVVYTGAADTRQAWVTYVLPLPFTPPPYRINSLLTTTDTATNASVISSLNFETHSEPTPVCSPSTPYEFTPTNYVDVLLFKGHALLPEPVTGSFVVQNSTDMSMAESLSTLILLPKDSVDAITYFEHYPTETILLDTIYMSHALDADLLPTTLHNKLLGEQGGRSTLELDQALLSQCPLEQVSSGFTLDQNTRCVTTLDWALDGQKARPVSSVNGPYFVHQALLSAESDLKWLEDNIFGTAGAGIAAAFYAQVQAKLPAQHTRKQHAAVYWVWPLYQWHSRSPIGLVDRTLVSFSWSLTDQMAASRRLLEIHQHVFNQPEYRKNKIARRMRIRRKLTPGSEHHQPHESLHLHKYTRLHIPRNATK